MNRIHFVASTAGLALALLAGAPALAQEQTAAEVMTELEQMGIDTDGLVLTEDEVLQIDLILSGTDTDVVKKAEIEALMAD